MHLLTDALHLPAPRDEVFAFFAAAENLQLITPRELGFEIVTPAPIRMAEGTLIEYRLHLFGVPIPWKTRISCWQPPFLFQDEQLRGPYRRWVHTHTFEDHSSGGTDVRDRVEYELPFWPFGEVAYPIVRLQLQRIFQFRKQALEQRFGVRPTR
jgi:ligand-binding SRPBCC domain-containing protein